MHRAKVALLATLLIAAPAIQAQTTLPANARVRVTSWNGQRVIGRLAEVRGDTLMVVKDGLLWNPTYRIPLDRGTRVDVSRGKYVHAGRVIGGALLGAVAGFITVVAVPGISTTECSGDVCGTGPAFPAAMAIGVAGGIMLGVLTPADRWEAVHSPVRIGFGGDGQHGRLGVSLAF
jgi:hypothetical protein